MKINKTNTEVVFYDVDPLYESLMVLGAGIEPARPGFSVQCSTC